LSSKTGAIRMTEKITKRGFDVEDFKWFSEEAIARLKIAQEEIEWLLNRGYKFSSIIDLIGGHYQFSSRQRTALQRATSSKAQYEKRKETMLPVEAYKEDCIYIDGFNLIITLEVALSGSILILGNDGVIRDLAGLRGTYRLIDKTDEAIKLIGKALKELKVSSAKFFLDAPVSNSGRLRSKILEYSSQWNIPVEVELVPNADPILSKMKRVITSDSIILDQCGSWFNLSRKIVEVYIKDTWIVDLEF
jgi:hypothetical protein